MSTSKRTKFVTPLESRPHLLATALMALDSGEPIPPAALDVAREVLATHLEVGEKILDRVLRLEQKIGLLTFSTEAQKELLLLEVARLPTVSDSDVREKILDRLATALRGKAPDPPPPPPTKSATVLGGRVYDLPEGLAGLEL